MPAKRITVRKIRDVLRLRLAAGLSIRQIKASTKLSVGAIQKLLAGWSKPMHWGSVGRCRLSWMPYATAAVAHRSPLVSASRLIFDPWP